MFFHENRKLIQGQEDRNKERWSRPAWEQFSLCLVRGHVTGVISMPDMAGLCPRLLTASSLVFSLSLSSSHNRSFPRRRVRSWRSGKCKFGRANGVPVAAAPWVSTASSLSLDFFRFFWTVSNCRQRFCRDVHLCFRVETKLFDFRVQWTVTL